MARQTEPNPWTSCWAEKVANEEPARCAFCDACEVAEEGDFCSDECEALSKKDATDDFAHDVAAATEAH